MHNAVLGLHSTFRICDHNFFFILIQIGFVLQRKRAI